MTNPIAMSEVAAKAGISLASLRQQAALAAGVPNDMHQWLTATDVAGFNEQAAKLAELIAPPPPPVFVANPGQGQATQAASSMDGYSSFYDEQGRQQW